MYDLRPDQRLSALNLVSHTGRSMPPIKIIKSCFPIRNGESDVHSQPPRPQGGKTGISSRKRKSALVTRRDHRDGGFSNHGRCTWLLHGYHVELSGGGWGKHSRSLWSRYLKLTDQQSCSGRSSSNAFCCCLLVSMFHNPSALRVWRQSDPCCSGLKWQGVCTLKDLLG